MQRDMDLVREILFAAEKGDFEHERALVRYKGSWTDEQINYHIYLMMQAGLVEASISREIAPQYPTAILTSITWQGHDFLDAARNDTIWEKAKKLLKEKGLSASFEILKNVLTEEALKLIT